MKNNCDKATVKILQKGFGLGFGLYATKNGEIDFVRVLKAGLCRFES